MVSVMRLDEKLFLKDKNLLGKKALAIITKKNVINIDSFDELRLARKLNYAI